ncbi:unnamed protein product, partial [Prorocentrum cordatum]
ASLKRGAGGLHRHTKLWGPPEKNLSMEKDQAGEPIIDQLLNTQHKAEYWSTFWRVEQQTPQQQACWSNFRAAARKRSYALEPTTSQEVAEVVKVFEPVIEMGADRTNPRWWSQLPQEGVLHLAYFLNLAEQSLAWPAHIIVNVVQLMYKSEQPDRPIALTQATCRVWSRIRRPQVADWAEFNVQFWDKAVAGSSCLRAALRRYIHLDMATVQGISWCEASKGILAGCSQSVDMSRLALFQMVTEHHAQCIPVYFQSWVDDVAQAAIGTERDAIEKTTRAATAFANQSKEQSLRISVKSTLVSNPPRIAKAVQSRLLRVGVALKASQFVEGPGVDGAPRRRATVSGKTRRQASAARGAMIKRVAKTARSATGLTKTGSIPQDRGQALEIARGKAWTALTATSKWSRVKGALAAAAAALQDIGFSPQSPRRWRNQDGGEIDLEKDGPER